MTCEGTCENWLDNHVSNNLIPAYSCWCTFTSYATTTPVAIFLNEGSEANGVQLMSFEIIFKMLVLSLFIPASVDSLSCSLVVNEIPVKSFIIPWYSDVIGMDVIQRDRCSSITPLLCVRPPVLFSDRIIIITISQLRLAQKLLVRQIT